MTDGPDPFSNAWYRQQFTGQQFSINKCLAEYVSADERIEALVRRVSQLERDREQDRAEIGKLNDTIDKMREVYKEIRGELKNGHIPLQS